MGKHSRTPARRRPTALLVLGLLAGCSSTNPSGQLAVDRDAAVVGDAAQPGPDAAEPGQDAEPEPGQDAAEPGQDAEPTRDAAEPGQDAEPTRDAGVNADAEPSPDATSGRDATVTPDSGVVRDAGVRDAGGGAVDAGSGAGPARALGTVLNLQTNVACGSSGVPNGGTCTSMTVRCAGIPDMTAIIAITRPSGTSHGTVVAYQGSGGTDFYLTNIRELVQAGYTTAQVRWSAAWQNTPLGITDGACRPATTMQWVFDQVHNASRTTGFCAIGHSGGSGQIAYTLSHYGMESVLDYASLGAGPPFARIDCGCAPQTCPGPHPLCPALPDAPVDLPGGMDVPENTTSCRDANPLPQDLTKWAADSVVSPTGDFDYPNTVVDFYDCTNGPNGTTGGAYFYSNAISTARSVTCFTAADGCANEGVGTVGNAAILADMLARCVPRH